MTDGVRIALIGHDGSPVRMVRDLEMDRTLHIAGHGPVARAAAVAHSARAQAILIDIDGGAVAVDAIETTLSTLGIPIIALSRQMDPHLVARARNGGALDVLTVPADGDTAAMDALRRRIRTLARVAVVRQVRHRAGRTVTTAIIGIAASTGGPEALARVLTGLHDVAAPVLVVQHIHADFVERFAGWMASRSGLEVKLAEALESLRPGTVYVAPPGRHLRVSAEHLLVLDENPVTVHRPSADVLFTSMAATVGPRAIGVVLTGMGDDGALGLLALRRCGAVTIVQDEESSTIYGMPKAARDMGAALHTLPLNAIPEAVLSAAKALAR